MTRVLDISLPITESMAIYPGDPKVLITSLLSASGGSRLSEINFGSHTGTHIDAPSHAVGNKNTIDTIPLKTFYGRCRVVDMTKCEEAITLKDIKRHKIKSHERVLFKTTNSLRGFKKFYDDYIYLDNEAATYLASLESILVGIDALSIKKKGLKDNTAHTALLDEDIPILEGLNLADIDAGEYTLCAFPLAFEGIDGSPVRAVLLSSS
jgi:arylformamidase